MRRLMLPCCFFLMAIGLQGISHAKERELEITRMTIHPAALPSPAMKYRLLPDFIDKRPGNAAVYYNQMWAERYGLRQEINKNWREYYSWIEMPIDQLPQNKVEKYVRMTSRIYDDFKWASRLETCDWCLPIREGNPLCILLPQIQEKRGAARMFAVRARLQIAQGKFDEAIDTLQTSYALGRNMGEGKFLVSSLVGIAICGITSNQVETIIQQPECPNLYWTLTMLPSPLVDTRPAFEPEYDMLFLAYPELRHVEDPKEGPEYARLWIEHMIREPAAWQENMWDTPSLEKQEVLRAMLTGMILRGYPMAKRALIAGGRSTAEVKAMPVTQVVAIYTVQNYNKLRDEHFKWIFLPWWQVSQESLRKVNSSKDINDNGQVFPFQEVLLNPITVVKFAETRCERQIAILRTIEALRLYAAAHNRQMPKRLEDITEVPIPMDPMTGRPIKCEITDGVAVINVYYQWNSKKPDRRIEIRMAK